LYEITFHLVNTEDDDLPDIVSLRHFIWIAAKVGYLDLHVGVMVLASKYGSVNSNLLLI
jgi:hypothetical protein